MYQIKRIVFVLTIIIAALNGAIPSAPTTITASDDTYADKVIISDYSVSGATQYRIYRAISEDGSKTYLYLTSSLSYSDYNAVPGTIYYYFVKACNAEECSEYSHYEAGSRAQTSRSHIAPPSPIAINASDGIYTDRVVVSNYSVSGATSYLIYRESSDGKKIFLEQTESSIYSDYSATSGSLYNYYVRACHLGDICSGDSNYDVGYKKGSSLITEKPTTVSASDGTYADKVAISVNNVIGAENYRIYRAANPNESKTLLDTITTLDYNDYSASVGVEYYYFAKACNSTECGGWSTYEMGYRGAKPAIPAIPTMITASDGTYTDKIVISDYNVNGATRYEIYRAIDEDGWKTLVGTTSSSSYNDTSAAAGTGPFYDDNYHYYYFVKACNSGGCSRYSGSDQGYRWYGSAPAPSTVTATDGAFNDRIVISDYSVSGATSYRICRATSVDGEKVCLPNTSSTEYDDTSAIPGITYYYFVRALYDGEWSVFSHYDTGYMWSASAPPTPGDISASDGVNSSGVAVSNYSVSGATSYQIFRNGSYLDQTSSSDFGDYSAIPGIHYLYCVKACNSTGCSECSYGDKGHARLDIPVRARYINATDGTYTDRVVISNYSVAGATHYQIFRSTNTIDGSGTRLKEYASPGYYSDASAVNGTIYYYFVKACNSAGCSDASYKDAGHISSTTSAPTNITATDGTYTDKVVISNYSVSGATSYWIYRATSSGGIKTKLASTTSASYNDTSAIPGTTYYYFVKAYSSAGSSIYSDYDTGYRKQSTPTPAIPTTIGASDGTYTDKVEVTSYSVSGATSYKIYRAESAEGSKILLGTTASESYSDTNVISGVTHYYFVQACSSAGCSGYSTYDTGYRGTISIPEIPSNFTASDGTYDDKVEVTSYFVSGATSYAIYRATSAGGTKTPLLQTASSGYNDTSAVLGTMYYYFVRAGNSAGWSGYSGYDTGFRGQSTSVPAIPSAITATDGTYTDKVVISNYSVSGATSYRIYRAASAGGSKTLLVTTTSVSYSDTSVMQGSAYYYYVAAGNSAGWSGYSNYDRGYAKVAVPATPTAISASDGSYSNMVSISGYTVSGATYYKIYRAAISSGTKIYLGSILNSSILNSYYYYDNSATPGTTYYYFVQACSSAGCSGYSTYDTGYSKVSIPPVPTTITATDGTYTDKVVISSYYVSGATSYKIYRSTSSSSYGSEIKSTISTSWNDYDASPGTNYYYRVKACNSSGQCSEYSAYDRGQRKQTTEIVTLSHIGNVIMPMNADSIYIGLEIINTTNENETISSVSSDTDLVVTSDTNPMEITPVYNAKGQATIRVTVSAGGKSDSKEFTVYIGEEPIQNDLGWLTPVLLLLL